MGYKVSAYAAESVSITADLLPLDAGMTTQHIMTARASIQIINTAKTAVLVLLLLGVLSCGMLSCGTPSLCAIM